MPQQDTAPATASATPAKAVKLRRVTREELRSFIAEHHRHTDAPRQSIVKVGVDVHGDLVAVGCGASPVSRVLDDGETIEISRVCTKPGEWPNACSMIYGALCRAAKAQGFARAVTYTLTTERGTSPSAAGFKPAAECKGRVWQTERRTQTSMFAPPTWAGAARRRWEKQL